MRSKFNAVLEFVNSGMAPVEDGFEFTKPTLREEFEGFLKLPTTKFVFLVAVVTFALCLVAGVSAR